MKEQVEHHDEAHISKYHTLQIYHAIVCIASMSFATKEEISSGVCACVVPGFSSTSAPTRALIPYCQALNKQQQRHPPAYLPISISLSSCHKRTLGLAFHELAPRALDVQQPRCIVFG